jgi:ribosomal protein L7Ae-like RNA K-turn-binding protein
VNALEREPKRLGHAFKGRVDASGLAAALRQRVLDAVLDGLSLASAAGQVVGGHDAVELAIRDGRVAELVVASDASGRTVADVVRGAEGLPTTVLPLDKERLGARIGHPPRAVVGIVASPAFRHLREQLHRLRSLG